MKFALIKKFGYVGSHFPCKLATLATDPISGLPNDIFLDYVVKSLPRLPRCQDFWWLS